MSQPTPTHSQLPEPTWDVAHLFPAQGDWSEQEYLGLNSNRLVEFSHGFLEVLADLNSTTSRPVSKACRSNP